jgi:hypothetical protein
MVEKLKTYMHGFPTRAVVIDRVRELGIKGWPRDPTCCLVARLMEKDLGLRLSVTRRQVWHDHDSLVRLTDPFVAVIDDFDAGGYPELVETS